MEQKPLSEAIQAFLAQQQSMATRENYALILAKWAKWAGSDWPDEGWAYDYQNHLVEQGLSNNTVNHYLVVLKSFYQRFSLEDITVKKLNGKPRQLEILTDNEVKQLLTAADLKFGAVLRFMLDTGVRVQELVNISRTKYDLSGTGLEAAPVIPNEYIIIGKGQKQRRVQISSQTRAILALIADFDVTDKTGYIFGQRWTVGAIQYRLRELGKLLKWTKNCHPHLLRHYFATKMLQDGVNIVDVQKMLGHSSVATTQIYSHVTDERIREVWSRALEGRGE